MLPCVCSVIDQRRRQNVLRTSVAHEAIAECVTDVLTSKLIWKPLLVHSLARLPTETVRVFFLNQSKKETVFSSSRFSYLFFALTRLFWILSFSQSRKILSKFSNLHSILKHRGKNFVMMTSIVRLSSNG